MGVIIKRGTECSPQKETLMATKVAEIYPQRLLIKDDAQANGHNSVPQTFFYKLACRLKFCQLFSKRLIPSHGL